MIKRMTFQERALRKRELSQRLFKAVELYESNRDKSQILPNAITVYLVRTMREVARDLIQMK